MRVNKNLAANTSLSHYRIVSKIGAGGMGEVYLAQDTKLDQRSDIFSFGCILFEAVTGKKPFEGESVVKSLHMVIYEPPPSISELSPAAPAELQRIIRRCLAKDPDERYQSIKEVAIELKELRRELGAAIDTTVPPARRETIEAQSLGATISTPPASLSTLTLLIDC